MDQTVLIVYDMSYTLELNFKLSLTYPQYVVNYH